MGRFLPKGDGNTEYKYQIKFTVGVTWVHAVQIGKAIRPDLRVDKQQQKY